MIKNTLTSLLLLLISCILSAQDFAGKWMGELSQNGKPDIFNYEVELNQEGNKVYGTATSTGADGTIARFEIGGRWDDDMLTLQEVEQLEPPGACWCLKHIRLRFAAASTAQLEGDWEAQGCTPGSLFLRKQGAPKIPENAAENLSGAASALVGKWSGYLSQTDRDYGFYFEIILEAGGTGTSHITSDSEGGNASHRLNWQFDEAHERLTFKESDILEKSVPAWRWCLKQGQLIFKKEENRLSLSGDWEGFIEGYSAQSGPCAPGKLYVERPIFKPEHLAVAVDGATPVETRPIDILNYEKSQGREVEVERVLEVKNRTVRIRVWDSGTIDGDVCTLFLNGQIIVKDYRTVRRKHETIVKLEKPTNYLILHAINLGRIPPNTISVSVDDGVKEQTVILSSNLKTSGAIMIQEFTVSTSE